MDAFEKFGAAVRRGLTLLGVSIGSACRKMKLRVHIDTLNSDLEKLKSELADAAYTSWKNGDGFAALTAKLETMDEKVRKISELKEEIKAVDYKDNEIFGWESGQSAAPAAAAAAAEEAPAAEAAPAEAAAEAEADTAAAALADAVEAAVVEAESEGAEVPAEAVE